MMKVLTDTDTQLGLVSLTDIMKLGKKKKNRTAAADANQLMSGHLQQEVRAG